jgi:hypothetical protein
MYFEFNAINLYFALTGNFQTSATLLVVFVSLSQSVVGNKGFQENSLIQRKYKPRRYLVH